MFRVWNSEQRAVCGLGDVPGGGKRVFMVNRNSGKFVEYRYEESLVHKSEWS